jgi:uncharacterized protein DUF6188
MALVEHEDRWSAISQSGSIERVCIDWAITLLIRADDEEYTVRIEESISLRDPAGVDARLTPADEPSKLGPVLPLLRRSAVRLDAFKDGRLEIETSEGDLLTVLASEDFEPWEISGPNGTRLVSTPDKAVSVWRPSKAG